MLGSQLQTRSVGPQSSVEGSFLVTFCVACVGGNLRHGTKHSRSVNSIWNGWRILRWILQHIGCYSGKI